VRHDGEEVIYVIKGRIEVHTEFYDPVTIDEGETIYIDSSMGHAYLVADGCEEALTLGVCSAEDEHGTTELMALFGETAPATS
jgi:quercetin dioxygenase-like cupin family protein